MLKAKLLTPIVAAAAIGGYAFYENDIPTFQTAEEKQAARTDVVTSAQTEKAIQVAAQPVAVIPASNNLQIDNVLRFDVYPNWVKHHWPRISTAPRQPGLSGMRVALVTGTQPHDLTGSLTYYFDDTHRVQKIEFIGRTDDASYLVSLLTNQFEFETQKSLDAGFYVAGSKRNPKGVLKLSHPTTVKNSVPGQVLVYFEITAPKSRFPLGLRSRAILENENFVNRAAF